MRGDNLKVLFCLLLLSSSQILFAQQAVLSEKEIDSAIQYGTSRKGKNTGLQLIDKGKQFLRVISDKPIEVSSGFSITLYTPYSWVSQMASDAAKEYRKFTKENVDEGMLLPILRIVVQADKPGGDSNKDVTSVQHVVIRDEARTDVVQPVHKESFGEAEKDVWEEDHGGLIAFFELEDLARIRALSKDQEFFVTVIGENDKEKNFKIKKKFFEKLH